MDEYDLRRISEIKPVLQHFSVAQALGAVSPGAGQAVLDNPAFESCTFDHYGYLVFPDEVPEVVSALEVTGFAVDSVVPSVVVKSRLCRRYRLSAGDLEVSIVRGSCRTNGFGLREIEVFAAVPSPGRALPVGMVDRERHSMDESHLAIMVREPAGTLAELRRQLLGPGGLVADGGGYNPLEKPHEGGRSVLYFRATDVGPGRVHPHRLELTCSGEHSVVIADHVAATDEEITTGAHR